MEEEGGSEEVVYGKYMSQIQRLEKNNSII